jgi:glycosyltransferase involved in cell wall biosynthesis
MEGQLISVIMPAYNEEKFIGEAIESVRAQTYSNWELIIVDDASKDKTMEIIEQYVSTDSRIKLHRFSVNQGACTALNQGFKEARGEYICWLSADDRYMEGMLESEYRFLTDNRQMQAVFSVHEFINEKSEAVEAWFPPEEYLQIGQYGCVEPYNTLFYGGNAFNACTVMATREAFCKAGEFNAEHPYAGDYDFMLRLAAYSDIGFLNKVNVQSRIHQGQVTNEGHNDIDAIHVFEAMLYNDDLREALMRKAGVQGSRIEIADAFAGRMRMYKWRDQNEEVAELKKIQEKFTATFPPVADADVYCVQMAQRIDNKEWDEAVRMFQTMPQGIKAYADMEKLSIIAAMILDHNGEYKEEKELLNSLLRFNQQNYEAHYMTGMVFEREGKMFEALDSYVAALKSSAGNRGDFQMLAGNIKRFLDGII